MKSIINIKKASLFVMLSSLFISCNTKKFMVWMGTDKEQKVYNLKYGEEKKQKMDVFLPSKYPKNSPVIVLIHGGAWTIGKKEHMIQIQKMLFKNDIPSINMNYRLVDKNITYKQQLEDISLALKKFNELAGQAELEPNNYILLGESSGGHIALLYGFRNPEQVHKIISLSGPTDFYSEKYLKSGYSKYSSPTIAKMVGTKFDRNNLSLDFKEASPIYNISNVPVLHFQGNTDFLVPSEQGKSLDSLLTEKQVSHKFIFMKNTGHVPRFFSKKKRDSIIFPEIINWIKDKK